MFLSRFIHAFVLAAVVFGLAGIAGQPAPAAAASERLVLAFYYSWYLPRDFTTQWMSDIPVEPYDSSQRSTMERQIDQAKAAGIDGFILAWEGPGRDTDTNLQTLLDVARQKNFRVGVYFETRVFRSQTEVVNALRFLTDQRANHPAFLRQDGRPVIFFWDTDAVARAGGESGPDAWAAVRNQVDPTWAGQLWINEGVDVSFLRVFDGHHLFDISWTDRPEFHLGDWGGRVRDYAARTGSPKLWVATVMPGYDDTRTGNAQTHSRARDNGGYYRRTWDGAAASNADWVIITSWNEWYEGSAIEPGRTYGNLYLDLTRQFGDAWRGAQAAALAPEIAAPTASDVADQAGCVVYVEYWAEDGSVEWYPIAVDCAG